MKKVEAWYCDFCERNIIANPYKYREGDRCPYCGMSHLKKEKVK